MPTKKRRRHQRRAARRSGTRTAGTVNPTPATPLPAAPATESPQDRDERRRAATLWPIAAVGLLLAVGTIASILLLARPATELAATPTPEVVAGVPDGQVIPEATPSPRPSPTDEPTPEPTPSVAPAPAATDAPAATPVPVAVATPAPAPPPPPSSAPSPVTDPPVVVAAMAGPDDTVAAFYGHVVDGRFEEAYDLWSASMKAAYPRQSNVDDRFDETASIEFSQLFVAEQSATGATVQANFVETSDSGSSREFVGFWRLVLVDGRWLLDEPHY